MYKDGSLNIHGLFLWNQFIIYRIVCSYFIEPARSKLNWSCGPELKWIWHPMQTSSIQKSPICFSIYIIHIFVLTGWKHISLWYYLIFSQYCEFPLYMTSPLHTFTLNFDCTGHSGILWLFQHSKNVGSRVGHFFIYVDDWHWVKLNLLVHDV